MKTFQEVWQAMEERAGRAGHDQSRSCGMTDALKRRPLFQEAQS
jgi:hypothetical protein